MPQRQKDDLRQWAVIGAEHRLLEIAEEAAAIFQAFPELRDRGFMADGAKRASGPARGPKAGRAPAAPRRRRLSAAARKRIGDAQRRRWAKRRASGPKEKRR